MGFESQAHSHSYMHSDLERSYGTTVRRCVADEIGASVLEKTIYIDINTMEVLLVFFSHVFDALNPLQYIEPLWDQLLCPFLSCGNNYVLEMIFVASEADRYWADTSNASMLVHSGILPSLMDCSVSAPMNGQHRRSCALQFPGESNKDQELELLRRALFKKRIKKILTFQELITLN